MGDLYHEQYNFVEFAEEEDLQSECALITYLSEIQASLLSESIWIFIS